MDKVVKNIYYFYKKFKLHTQEKNETPTTENGKSHIGHHELPQNLSDTQRVKHRGRCVEAASPLKAQLRMSSTISMQWAQIQCKGICPCGKTLQSGPCPKVKMVLLWIIFHEIQWWLILHLPSNIPGPVTGTSANSKGEKELEIGWRRRAYESHSRRSQAQAPTIPARSSQRESDANHCSLRNSGELLAAWGHATKFCGPNVWFSVRQFHMWNGMAPITRCRIWPYGAVRI